MKKVSFFVSIQILFLSNLAFAQSSPYEITAKFVSENSYAACTTLEAALKIEAELKDANITAERKRLLEDLKEMLDLQHLNGNLSRTAVTLLIGFNLPASFQLNKNSFFIQGLDGKKVGTFSSNMIYDMDENGLVVSSGSGRGQYKLELAVAAFCPFVSQTNPQPAIEKVLKDLIK